MQTNWFLKTLVIGIRPSADQIKSASTFLQRPQRGPVVLEHQLSHPPQDDQEHAVAALRGGDVHPPQLPAMAPVLDVLEGLLYLHAVGIAGDDPVLGPLQVGGKEPRLPLTPIVDQNQSHPVGVPVPEVGPSEVVAGSLAGPEAVPDAIPASSAPAPVAPDADDKMEPQLVTQ